MRHEYIIYPLLEKRLQETSLQERIDRLMKKHEGPGPIGFLYADEFPGYIEEMDEKGYFKTLPAAERKRFMDESNAFFKKPESYQWIIERPDGQKTEKAELEDLLLTLGWYSTFILSPDEIWDYKRFGFSSITEFTGSVGAAIRHEESKSIDDGLRWRTQFPNGKIMLNEIAGNSHYDLYISQDDITPYKTTDPFGNEVHYRPRFSSDRKGIAGGHSVEDTLLVSILKYVHQQKIPSKLLENDAKLLLDWAKTMPQRGGATTEHIFNSGSNVKMAFIGFEYPIFSLDHNFMTDMPALDGISSGGGEGHHGMFVGPNKELIFSRSKEPYIKGVRTKRDVSAIYLPSEIDEFIKSLFYQCAHGLGRTPMRNLMPIINEYINPEFKAELKNREAEAKKMIEESKHAESNK